MRRFLFLILLLTVVCCLWCACTAGDSETEKRLFAGMDSLLEANPDSAYKVLTAMQKEVDSIDDEAVSMRHRMHLASAANKLFLPMPSDSCFMDVVSWYDLHGTANDRMRARYLLGCIYRDRKEAPQAVRYYQEAPECADTASIDCDYATLFRIYYQMGYLYYYHYFPEKTLECYRQWSYYSQKASDMYNYIRGIELQADPYYLMADTAKIMEITDSAYHLFLNNNMPENAARVFPHAIYIHINRGEYGEARKLMDIFEQESGLFDSEGNIMNKGYGRYDYARGLYSLWQGETEQAKRYFLRLFENGFEYEAYDGLARIYRQQSNPDSVYKYVELSDKVLTAQLEAMQIQAVTLSNSLYDYNRLERISDKAVIQAERAKRWFWISVLSALLLIAFLVFRHHLKQKEASHVRAEYSEISRQYFRFKSDCESLRLSLTELRQSTNAKDGVLESLHRLINDKESEIVILKEKLENMRKTYAGYLHLNGDSARGSNIILKSDVYAQFIFLSKYKKEHLGVSDAQWEQMMKEVCAALPDFYSFITSDSQLSDLERKTCVLVRLGFKTKEIMVLLGENNMQSVSNLKSKVKKKLFPNSQNHSLEELIRKI